MFGGYGFKEVDVDYLASVDPASIHLLDVRTDAEVARGVIEGAVHLPLHLLPMREHDIPKDKPVIIYCNSGARSAQACAFLAAKGYTNMHNLAGGIMAWMRAGKPLTTLG
ncbi:MAG: rhodanese-like domain-containing protein [Pseudomonadota bacterium]